MTTNEILDLALTAAATGVLLAPLVALLERTHRRTTVEHGGRPGWTTDRHDADARRLHDELRARAGEEPVAARTATDAGRRGSARTHRRPGVRLA